MNTRMYFAALIALTACASAPAIYHTSTLNTADATYVCALSQVNERGYTVMTADKESARIIGQRQFHNASLPVIGGNVKRDELNVAIYPDSDGKSRKMRITALSDQETRTLLSTRVRDLRPTPQVRADASAILKACGDGVVVTEGAKR